MRTQIIRHLFVSLLCSVVTAELQAQPTAFTYQGRLNENGSPAAGIYDLRFTIYDAANGGEAVGGSITNTAVAVADGLFTATLDFGAGAFDGSDRWLEIGAVTNGGAVFDTLAPRQLITSTPYAITATTAGNAVTAGSVTGYVSASQLTGTLSSNNIGAGSITSVMLADGTITTGKLAAGSVTRDVLADGAVTGIHLEDGAVSVEKLATHASGSSLSMTFESPSGFGYYFGSALDAVGSEGVLIGDYAEAGSGLAYLFHTNGLLVNTFTNPTPAQGDSFGHAVAGVGSDRVLIGAHEDDHGATDSGVAYLFQVDGTLLTTFTNPIPKSDDWFGYFVAPAGADKVLIGAPGAPWGSAGSVHLFGTSGALLTTITNPQPLGRDFGAAASVVGTDRLLIGASGNNGTAGGAYLFSTNGTLLTTFTNPTPDTEDYFGDAVAAVGRDKVLIGAYRDDATAADGGVAYLFNTNGTLLTTFTNPTPISWFGYRVAAAGADQVIISANGRACLFDLNGKYLAPLWGWSWGGHTVATLSKDTVIVGSVARAHLIHLEKPFVPGLVSEAVLDGVVTTGSLADGAVTSNKLASGSVTADQLAEGSVGTAQLAPGSVFVGQFIGDGGGLTNLSGDGSGLTNLNASKLSGFISSNNIADGTIASNKLAYGSVTPDHIVAGSIGLEQIQTSTFASLSRVIENPTPAAFDEFGLALAAMGTGKLLIGAPLDDTHGESAGAAYLFDIDGILLTTLSAPVAAAGDNFGASVAAIGADHLLVGASGASAGATNAGAAYLFSAGGSFISTFTNPAPAPNDFFGSAIEAFGSDRVIVGAHRDDAGATDAGSAYLLNTNGTLLATFTNPAPAINDYFGIDVAAVGTHSVLIGAPKETISKRGTAYLFGTNGSLLRTFTSPVSEIEDGFGKSVAAVGTDKVLVGAYAANTGATDAGAAYLFDTNGLLLTTFTNPTPGGVFYLGWTVAALGEDRVVIGAYEDSTAAFNSGVAYLYGIDGRLLARLTNPAPINDDHFGWGVAAAGANKVLVGAKRARAGVANAGAAYLYNLDMAYVPGLVSEGVLDGTIHSESIANGAVGTEQLAAGSTFTGSFVGDGGGITNLSVPSGQIVGTITTSQIAGGAVTTGKIADGTIAAEDLSPAVVSNTFWRLNGNGGTTTGTHFVGTTDNQPVLFKVNNTTGLRLEYPTAGSAPILIGGDSGNSVDGASSGAVIGGGYNNHISSNSSQSAIAGGANNNIRTYASWGAIGGGRDNNIASNSLAASIAGGYYNDIGTNSPYSVIGGGYDNNITNNALYATIAGGRANAATTYAYAAGYNARALHSGAFVWSDGGGTVTTSAANNSVTFRARGGYRFFTGSGTSGAELLPGATAWSVLSDRNTKKDIQTADCQAILDKLAEVPVSQWHYNWEEASAPMNLGPMAQDFKAAFFPGRDDTRISTLEFDGVALAAIQGLNEKVEVRSQESEVRIQKLEKENAGLRQELAVIKSLLNQLTTSKK